MPQLTLDALRQQIAAGVTGPLYMLIGDDDLEKSAVAGEFVGMVEEGLEAFNVDRLYGGETRVDALADAASLFPMMAPRRVVILLDAEKLLCPKEKDGQKEKPPAPKRGSRVGESEQDRLLRFVKNAPSHATVVFVCGQLDNRRKVVTELRERASVIDCGTVRDADGAERWVKARAAKEGATLDPAAARALVKRTGHNVARLRAGLDRVLLYAMGEPAVTVEHVRRSVTVSAEAPENFGVANAIKRNDAAGALHELSLVLEGGAHPIFVLGQLRFAAENLPGSRLRSAIEAVFRTDLALKSTGGEPRLLLERLVVELCTPSRAPG